MDICTVQIVDNISYQRATIYCATGRALRISTAKPSACTAGYELVLHNGSFLGATASDSWRTVMAGCVPRAEWLSRYSTTVLPNGAHFWYKGDDGLWWLGKISASTATKGVYLVRFLDDPGSTKLPLTPARYTTSTGAVRGSRRLQVHLASAFARGVQRNADESRGAAVDS